MSRRELLDAGEHRLRSEGVPGEEIVGDALIVRDGRYGRMGEQRLDLRGAQEPLGTVVVVQRLDADTITRREDRPCAPIPDDECEHAVQALDALFAFLL